MDATQFDALTRALAGRTSRRLLAPLASVPLLGGLATLMAVDDLEAKKKKKKKTFCLNGETTVVKGPKKKLKKKVKKLRKQGATPGACSQPPPPPTCAWTNQTTFGSFGSGPNNFEDPDGVAITPDGLTALIVDVENQRVSVWTRPNTASAWSNQTTFGESEFENPYGVALTSDGLTALVSDIDNRNISVWTRPNASSLTWTKQSEFGSSGSDPDDFSAPVAVTVTLDGLTALIADAEEHRISVWTRPNATIPTGWSHQTNFGSQGSGPNNLDNPHAVAVTPDALTALIADTDNHRISVWTRTGANSTDWSNQTTFGSFGSGPSNFDTLYDVALTADGLTALIADNGNNRISVWTRPNASSPTGWSNQTTFGTVGSGSNNLIYPWGVAVTPDGQTAVVSDTGNDRMSVWGLTTCS